MQISASFCQAGKALWSLLIKQLFNPRWVAYAYIQIPTKTYTHIPPSLKLPRTTAVHKTKAESSTEQSSQSSLCDWLPPHPFNKCLVCWKAESLSVYMGDWYLIRLYETSPKYKICWTGHQWYEQRNIDYVKHNTVVQPQSNTIH